MRGLILLVGGLMTLSGCAGSPARIALESQDQLRSESTQDLCAAYGNLGHGGLANEALGSGKAAFAELQRRGAIRPEFFSQIENRSIVVGMSPCEVLASWGAPSTMQHTATTIGTIDLWTFCGDLDCNTIKGLIQLTNGAVSSVTTY